MCRSIPKSSLSHSCDGALHVLTQTLAHWLVSRNLHRSALTAWGTRKVLGKLANVFLIHAGVGTST